MNVLTICHDHPHVTDGGTEHAAHDLCRALADQPSVSSHFLGVSTSLNHPDIAPGDLHLIGGDYMLRTGRYDIFSMRREDGTEWIDAVGRLMNIVEPDVVHLHGIDRIGAEVIAVLRRLCPELRIVLTLHDFQIVCPNQGLLLRRDGGLCLRPTADACRRCFPEISANQHGLRKARLMRLLQEVDQFITPSRDVRARFIEWGMPADRITVLPNAVPEMQHPPRDERQRPNRFAYFGNLAEHKGVGVLLQAAAQLAKQECDLRITVHGRMHHAASDPFPLFAEALSAAAPVAYYLGPYDRRELPALMAQVDWLVLPSLWFENAPLVLSEARRAGLPVICTAIGGMQELVRHNVDGLLIPRGNPAALAELMADLSGDQALWARFARNICPPTTPQESARAHLTLYSELRESLSV